jgi:hypothetical protein
VNELRIQTVIAAVARRIAASGPASPRLRRRYATGALGLLLRRGSNVAVEPVAARLNRDPRAEPSGRENPDQAAIPRPGS